MTTNILQNHRAGARSLTGWVTLLLLAVALVACGGSHSSATTSGSGISDVTAAAERPTVSETRVPTSASIGDATAVASDPQYEAWAQAVCEVLDSALLQPETVSVSPGDLAAYFRSAATNSQDVAQKLQEIHPATGTASFMQEAESTFEDLAPILSETANMLDAASSPAGASGADDSAALRQVLDTQETKINQVFKRIRAASLALPSSAQRSMVNQPSCGAVSRE